MVTDDGARFGMARSLSVTASISKPFYGALPVNGLAGCYVSTIGKPHEYFDLTGTPTGNGEKQIGRAYGAPCQPSTLPRFGWQWELE